MSERSIILRDWEVRAFLEGRKTQVRRVVKPQPEFAPIPCHYVKSGWSQEGYPNEHGVTGCACGAGELASPFGAPGDVLWAKETMRTGSNRNHEPRKNHLWRYDADNEVVEVAPEHKSAMVAWAHHKDGDACASIHMPRWASRLSLRVLDVRVQRLQEITEDEARAEGVRLHAGRDGLRYATGAVWVSEQHPAFDRGLEPSARAEFACLWDSHNKRFPWSSNPLVWAATVEPIGSASAVKE